MANWMMVCKVVQCRPGLLNTITYTCALKQITSQAYVHIQEDNNSENAAFMGLILKKYVQDAAKLDQQTWDGNAATHAQDMRV